MLASVFRLKVKRLIAARVLATFLAAAVVSFGLLAANGALHRTLHQGGTADSGSCVLCLFAHGHADSPEAVLVTSAFVPTASDLPVPAVSAVKVDFTYLLSPSRAPPVLADLLPVVA